MSNKKFIVHNIIEGMFPVGIAEKLADGNRHRRCVTPDDDISDLPKKVQDEINAYWNSMDLNEWEKIKNPPEPELTDIDIEMMAREEIREEFLRAQEDKGLAARIAKIRTRILN